MTGNPGFGPQATAPLLPPWGKRLPAASARGRPAVLGGLCPSAYPQGGAYWRESVNDFGLSAACAMCVQLLQHIYDAFTSAATFFAFMEILDAKAHPRKLLLPLPNRLGKTHFNLSTVPGLKVVVQFQTNTG